MTIYILLDFNKFRSLSEVKVQLHSLCKWSNYNKPTKTENLVCIQQTNQADASTLPTADRWWIGRFHCRFTKELAHSTL